MVRFSALSDACATNALSKAALFRRNLMEAARPWGRRCSSTEEWRRGETRAATIYCFVGRVVAGRKRSARAGHAPSDYRNQFPDRQL